MSSASVAPWVLVRRTGNGSRCWDYLRRCRLRISSPMFSVLLLWSAPVKKDSSGERPWPFSKRCQRWRCGQTITVWTQLLPVVKGVNAQLGAISFFRHISWRNTLSKSCSRPCSQYQCRPRSWTWMHITSIIDPSHVCFLGVYQNQSDQDDRE